MVLRGKEGGGGREGGKGGIIDINIVHLDGLLLLINLVIFNHNMGRL